ncbi:MAG: hypothetical protein VKK97_02635 [Synechococcaceae cyanobacterium]|nr:hypothetical protein [Synechococcaceae cyanobacterium]
MTSNFSEREQIRFFSNAARLANRERISAVEEGWMRGILDRVAPAQAEEPGLPQQAVGDARDRNNLRRTNWFNGRYLTAEALSRQDVYFDHRSRLNAHALMPGIAWGLGIEGRGLNELGGAARRGGFGQRDPLTLRRGLAFDGVGRPILVSHDFSFTLEQLIGVSARMPRRVVGGQRQFMPCVCLAPEPGGPGGGSAALPSGPYLLVIEAGEVPEGQARVTGDVCGGRRSEACAADVWRGSFGLSLVRFPVEAPLRSDIPDVWALRGTLSAYYFDVFEHPLWSRWDPEFPIDGSFGRGSEPGRHEGMAIPLALVHLGEDGTALYLDSWIPRRLITATPGEDWHRVRIGAPPRAAAWARIHQFQTMLRESLLQANTSRPAPGQGALPPENLHQRGFRHIPPIGFLPIRPAALAANDSPGQEQREACTIFRTMTTDQELPNPFPGTNASFEIRGNTNMYNSTLENNGFILERGSPPCFISLDEPAEEVTIQLKVEPGGNVVDGTGTSVIARGGAAAGSRNTLQTANVLQADRVETITLRASGIREIEIINKYRTYIDSFCYRYVVVTRRPAGLPPRSILVGEALRQAEAYFAGTNVVPYGVVALHDDDILEDLQDAFDKDPLQLEELRTQGDGDPLRNWPKKDATSSERIGAIGLAGLLLASQGAGGVLGFLLLLGAVLRGQGLDIDALVNRRTEVVKLVVPLQGLSRRHPLLGAIPEDAARQAQGWGLAGPADLPTATLAGLLRERGVDVLPRGHVVYVKQRLVLLDLVLKAVEVLQALVQWVLVATQQQESLKYTYGPLASQLTYSGTAAANPDKNVRAMTAATTNDYKVAFRALGENDRQLIRATLQRPVVQELLLQTMVSATPALAKGDRSQVFLDQVATVSSEQPAAIGDLKERQAVALAQVADAWAAEYPDAQVLQLLAAVQPAEQMLDLVKRLGAAPGTGAGPTVADGLELTPPTRFETNTERVLYADVRQRLEERPIKDLAVELPEGSRLPDTALVASLTVGDVLARSPEEAAKVLGGAETVEAITKAFLNERQAAIGAASGLADGVPAAVVAKVETEVAAGQQPEVVLEQLKREEEAKPEAERDSTLLRNLEDARTLLRLSGNRLEALQALRRRPEG